MSTFDYIAGASVERNISEQIALQRERHYQDQLRDVVARYDAAIEKWDSRLKAQIAYTERLERDLQRALAQLRTVGAPPIEREAADVSPHILRQQEEQRERRRREAARLAAMPTPQQVAEQEENERRGKKIFFAIVFILVLYANADDIIGYAKKENYLGKFMQTELVNNVYPFTKPERVTLEAFGCMNCHQRSSSDSFMVMESKLRRLKSRSDREATLQRFRVSIAQKPSIVRFGVDEKEVAKLTDDLATGRYPPL